MSQAGKVALSPELCHGNLQRKKTKKRSQRTQKRTRKRDQASGICQVHAVPRPPAAHELPGRTRSVDGTSSVPKSCSELGSSSQDTLVGTRGRAQRRTEGAGPQRNAERATGDVAFLPEETPSPWRWDFLRPPKTRSSSLRQIGNTHRKPQMPLPRISRRRRPPPGWFILKRKRQKHPLSPSVRSSPGPREGSPKERLGSFSRQRAHRTVQIAKQARWMISAWGHV